MEDTCSEGCPNYKKYFSKRKGNICPLYIETVWTSEKDHETKVMKDCSPKRSCLMMMDLTNRLIGAQKASEQSRNSSDKVAEKLTGFTNIVGKELQMLSKTICENYLEGDQKGTFLLE